MCSISSWLSLECQSATVKAAVQIFVALSHLLASESMALEQSESLSPASADELTLYIMLLHHSWASRTRIHGMPMITSWEEVHSELLSTRNGTTRHLHHLTTALGVPISLD